MHSQSLDAAILQLLCECAYYFGVAIPSQTGLHCNRNVDSAHHRTRDLKHFRNIAQHTCSSALAGHFLHRASEVDIEDVRLGIGYYSGGFHHWLDLAAVDLDGSGALPFGYMQFAGCCCDIADQSIGRYEFRVGHVGPLFLAY